jgi:hypothetical protein
MMRVAVAHRYIVFEKGASFIGGYAAYASNTAAVITKTGAAGQVAGVRTTHSSGLSSSSFAVASQSTIAGRDGSWVAIMDAGLRPLSASEVWLTADEDTMYDAEQRHENGEAAGIILFQAAPVSDCLP